MAMKVVAADVRNYLHRVIDDDFTINTNSNDGKAKRVSEERSIRANWTISLPLRLELRRQEYEVGIIAVQLKNVQTNSPRACILDSGSGLPSDVLAKELPKQRIETYRDLLQDLFPLQEVSAPMTMWLVFYNATDTAVSFVNLAPFLTATMPSYFKHDTLSLGEIFSKIMKDAKAYHADPDNANLQSFPAFFTTLPFKMTSRTAALRWINYDFNTVHYSAHTIYKGANLLGYEDNTGVHFNDGNFELAIVMDSNAASYLRLDYSSGLYGLGAAAYIGQNYELGHAWFSDSRWELYKEYHVLSVSSKAYVTFQPKVDAKPAISDAWESDAPLRVAFEADGDAHPNSSKQITLSVKNRMTLKFLSGDGHSVFTFKKGIIFQGPPLAFYEFLNRDIVGLFDFLTPDVGSVNIAVKGLQYRIAPLTSTLRMNNDFLVFNLPLTGSLVHYVPPPRGRMYRILEYVNVEELEIEITDALDSSRSPQFHVGISDVTLHFREILNNIFHL